jgi:hypothetical protein
VGSCATTLATGDECWADCASGYNTSGPTRCYLGRLQEAFASFERAVVEPDLASVDLDMELLDRALKDDLAPR